jgi:hypothetical protein
MKPPIPLLVLCGSLLISGCVQGELFLGATELRQQNLYATLRPTAVPENARYENYVGHPNGTLKSTGMTLEIGFRGGPIAVTNFKAEYEFDGRKIGPLQVPYIRGGGGNDTHFVAYLVPEATREAPEKALGNSVRPMKKGKYRVVATFDQAGAPRILNFEFTYQHTIEPYIGPVKTWKD